MATNSSGIEVKITGRDELSPQFDRLESRLIRFVGAIGAGIAALRIGTAPIAAAVNLERELANVRKTTNFLTADIDKLSKALLSMSTRIDVSALDLAKIAAAAGQQGLGREGVEGIVAFTESVARMASVLDLTAEDAAENIGKIANIFKIPLRDIEEAVSTFNEVSNNSTAKGEELLDVVRRIGDAAGNLNLQQSVALAATGLDFGQSPEVVGTAFAKVFTSLTQKADDFGRLLYGNVAGASERFVELMANDGLAGFQAVLAKLRTLSAQDQQNTIVKLFGGGRIGALLNKLVQDTTDSVLERNLASSLSGKAGISAIREQATVLNTFKAQATLTLNTLTKAGIEATNQLLPPLTQYVRELREALQSPALQSFFNALAASLGTVLDALASVVRVVASLNVNWENFVRVAQVFAAVGLAKAVFGITARMLGLGEALKSISTQAVAAKAGITAVAAANAAASAGVGTGGGRAARAAELLGYRELYDAIKKNQAAKETALKVSQDVAAKEAALARAQANASAAGTATRASIDLTRQRAQEVRAQRGNVFRAIQQGAAEEANFEAQRQARLQVAETAHQQRLAAIQASYDARRAAIRATGTETGLKALRAERAAQIAEQEDTHARSIAGVDRYWARRVAQAQVGAKAAVDAERLAYLTAVQKLDAAVTATGKNQGLFGRLQGSADDAAKAVQAANSTQAALVASGAATAAQTTLSSRLSAVWAGLALVGRTLGSVIATVGAALLTLASRLANVFFFVTILYSIADALGLVDKALPIFRKLTDAIGLTSQAERDAAVALETARKAREESRKEIESQTKAYNDLARASDPARFKQEVNALSTVSATADTQGARSEALDKLLTLGSAATKQLEVDIKTIDNTVRSTLSDTERQATDALERYTKLQQEYAAKLKASPADAGTLKATFEPQIRAAVQSYAALTEALDKARDSTKGAEAGLDLTAKNAAAVGDAIREKFTPQSAALLETYGGNIQSLYEQIGKLREQAKTAFESRTDANEGSVNATADAIQAQINALTVKATEAKAGLLKAINAIKGLPDTSEQLKKSLDDLLIFTALPADKFAVITNALKNATPDQLTGKGAGVNSGGSATGTSKFDPKVTGQESLARRLAKARIELAKAENDAQADLTQEYFRQQEGIESEGYARGIKSMEDYFARRASIQEAGIDAEIRRRELDLLAVKTEANKALDPAQKIQFQAEVTKLEGQIAVLRSRKASINDDTQRDIKRAREDFSTSVLESTTKLQEIGILPASVSQKFQDSLALLREKAKVELAKLRTEGRTALADALERSLGINAAEQVFNAEGTKVTAAFTDLESVRSRINQLRKEGSITSAEADRQLSAAVAAAIPKLQELIATQEESLNLLVLSGDTGSEAYQRLSASLDRTKLTLRDVANEVNTTARSINQGIGGAIESSLKDARYNFGGLDDFALDLALKIRKSLKDAFATNLSDLITTSLGLNGDGGIGGAIASLFGAGGSRKRDGSTPGSALYVTMQGGAKSYLEDNGDGTATELSFADRAIPVLQETFDKVKGGFSEFFSSVSSGFSTFFTSISDFFSSGSAGGGVDYGALVSWIATFFHSGGVVGSGGQRTALVDPVVFAGARRMHSGGMVGLKSNEVPIIAEEGETIRTQEQEAALKKRLAAGGSGADGAAGGVVNVWVVSPDQVPAMGPNDVIAVVNDNISRNGSIRKLIQQVNYGR